MVDLHVLLYLFGEDFFLYTTISCCGEGITLLKYADDLALVAHMIGTAALYPVNNLLKTFSENSHNSLKRLFSESDLSTI